MQIEEGVAEEENTLLAYLLFIENNSQCKTCLHLSVLLYFRGTKDVKSNRYSLKRTVVIVSSTQITKLTQPRPQGFSISVPFLATT